MENNDKFKSIYDSKNKVLTGKIEPVTIEKDDAKAIYALIDKSLKDNSDYSDYILDASNVNSIKLESFGYLMKALGVVKKTSGYMILVLRENVLQEFMLTNPEMFDYYAVFFNNEEALQYILSKR